ncbi:hypothetical protein GYMLUDRAFT_35244, partial [Collybiopsis luxurians FD-317 M1]
MHCALILWWSKADSDCVYSRRLQRETTTVDVWPPSPKASARELYVELIFSL